MTNKRMKLIAFSLVMLMIVAVLFLLSSTDLILKEEKTKVYNISVLVPDIDDTAWKVFQKGLDAGVSMWNADISFITLYEYEDAPAQQRTLVQREIDNGADALIVVPADADDMTAYLATLSGTIPVVLAGTPVQSGSAASVLCDWQQMAQTLAQQLAQRPHSAITAVCSRGALPQQRFAQITELFSAALDTQLPLTGLYSGGTYTTWMQQLPQDATVIVLEPSLLTPLADAKKAAQRTDVMLVSISNTAAGLTALEAGTLSMLLCTDEMQAGYLCVQYAVNALENARQQTVLLPGRVITAQNMYDDENAKILFPVG